MTLVARAAPPAYHKKITGKHHRHSKKYQKTYWPYLPLLLVVLAGLFLNHVLPGKQAVLGYASDMSLQSLLDGTNAQRSANGEVTLSLNQQLDAAAQAKANDMAARDYWSHNTPDGQTPWTFVSAAGYNYSSVGENLAYGFATASDTITGWMNSPGHRANILNAGYRDVGFGFVNIANYQGSGPETLVVAMYGTPAVTASATPAPIATTPSQSGGGSTNAANAGGLATIKPSEQSAAPTPAPTTSSEPQPTSPADQNAVATPTKQATKATMAPPAKSIKRAQILTAGKAPWSTLLLTLAGSAAVVIFLLRHAIAWHKVFIRGERFLLHHPLLDLALVSVATLALILSNQAGIIR